MVGAGELPWAVLRRRALFYVDRQRHGGVDGELGDATAARQQHLLEWDGLLANGRQCCGS